MRPLPHPDKAPPNQRTALGGKSTLTICQTLRLARLKSGSVSRLRHLPARTTHFPPITARRSLCAQGAHLKANRIYRHRFDGARR